MKIEREYNIPGYGKVTIGKGTQRYVAHNEAGQMISFGNSIEEVELNMSEIIDGLLRLKQMKLSHDIEQTRKGLEIITNIPQLNGGGNK